MSSRGWLASGALLAAVAVCLGAIGSHFFKDRLSPEHLATYETAVRYQLTHALGLMLLGLIAERYEGQGLQFAGGLFLLGTALFSGGLYGWLATGARLFVMIVPFGGAAWIAGWLAIAICTSRKKGAERG